MQRTFNLIFIAILFIATTAHADNPKSGKGTAVEIALKAAEVKSGKDIYCNREGGIEFTAESNDMTIVVYGLIGDVGYTDIIVTAERDDGTIVRGGPCLGFYGARCGGELTEVFNHANPTPPGPSGVTLPTGDGSMILQCARLDVAGLTGIVGECSVAYYDAVLRSWQDTQCDEPGWGNLRTCVGVAYDLSH